MKDTKTIFTKEQVERLNNHQKDCRFHPYTCPDDGDTDHIQYEFEKKHKGENYKEYIKKQKANGIAYPETEFSQTNLIATEQGWICPVCDYEQNWAH